MHWCVGSTMRTPYAIKRMYREHAWSEKWKKRTMRRWDQLTAGKQNIGHNAIPNARANIRPHRKRQCRTRKQRGIQQRNHRWWKTISIQQSPQGMRTKIVNAPWLPKRYRANTKRHTNIKKCTTNETTNAIIDDEMPTIIYTKKHRLCAQISQSWWNWIGRPYKNIKQHQNMANVRWRLETRNGRQQCPYISSTNSQRQLETMMLGHLEQHMKMNAHACRHDMTHEMYEMLKTRPRNHWCLTWCAANRDLSASIVRNDLPWHELLKIIKCNTNVQTR